MPCNLIKGVWLLVKVCCYIRHSNHLSFLSHCDHNSKNVLLFWVYMYKGKGNVEVPMESQQRVYFLPGLQKQHKQGFNTGL